MRIVIFIWICSIIPNLNSIVGLKSAKRGEGSFTAHCTAEVFADDLVIVWKIFYFIVLMMEYIIPILCMIFFFMRIHRKLHSIKFSAHSTTVFVHTGNLSGIQRRKKSVDTVIAMILCFFACWSLNQILYFMVNIGYGYPYNENLTQVSVVLCCFSSCINPLIYAFRSQLFKKTFWTLLRCCKKQKVGNAESVVLHNLGVERADLTIISQD